MQSLFSLLVVTMNNSREGYKMEAPISYKER